MRAHIPLLLSLPILLTACQSMPGMGNVEVAPNYRLERVEYVAETQTLTVLASDGVVYEYQRVPARVHERLMQLTRPEDQNVFYFRHIRGRYPVVKIRDTRGR